MMLTRRVLKDLQVSADDKLTASGSTKMVNQKKKGSKDLTKTSEDLKVNKQNTVKKTRRKNVETENEPRKVEVEKKTKKPAKKAGAKSSNLKVKNDIPSNSKLETTVILNQSRIESFLSPNTTLKCEDFTLLERGNVTVNTSFTEDVIKITSDVPPQSYWQDLSEQRQTAIEKTLLENEMLTDHLNVLQTENLQLKRALDAANQVLKIAGITS